MIACTCSVESGKQTGPAAPSLNIEASALARCRAAPSARTRSSPSARISSATHGSAWCWPAPSARVLLRSFIRAPLFKRHSHTVAKQVQSTRTRNCISVRGSGPPESLPTCPSNRTEVRDERSLGITAAPTLPKLWSIWPKNRLNARSPTMEPNFVNRTIWTGDNLDILRGINSETADLIYLDPPFNSNRNYAAPIGSKASGAAFKDTWTTSDLDVESASYIADEHPAVSCLLSAAKVVHSTGMQAYLTMMAVRLLEMQRILKPSGSIYLHCDPTASHYLKQLMDAVFGHDQFRNEIVWCYSSGGASKKRFSRKHDVLLLYGRERDVVHNVIRVAYATPDVEGRPGFHPEGKMLQDWWTDIGIISTTGSERSGYPTQKPLKLLERIITASSNENDVVLDPFAGCATTCVAAEKLNRQWVGIDLSCKSAELVGERLRGEFGDSFQASVTTRTDIPQRTDIGS
ncbi:MAG: site-specific DNA-methyltransferase [Acidimicrobiaceae bacterium]|nr:site-specific DNA-methyltransferase [Acidimicrobiaceae bacterium]MYG56137.1 site-specific DNA-methyltransferase [Acidimicrobiaceae bacterium]MYK00185.1 site-specific DNA-methyltransferase [Acidimicrobiaceae bacterium]